MLPELHSHGYLELFIGPMFSGKTSKLLELYKKYKLCNIKTTIINYIEDMEIDSEKKYEYLVFVQKIKGEFRDEKLLMVIVLHFILIRSDYTLENISFM